MNKIRCAQELMKIAQDLLAEKAPVIETISEDKFKETLNKVLGDKAKRISSENSSKLFEKLSKKGCLDGNKTNKTVEIIKKLLG